MEKGLHDIDHCAELIGTRSPPSVSGGATGIDQDLQDLLFVETYFADGTETIQLFFDSKRGINSEQL